MSALILRQKLVRKSLIHKLHVTLEMAQLWMDKHHQRKQLAQLDAHQLSDIGVSAHDLKSEIEQPFWR